MQLDRTLIAIHERSLLEIFDLTLHVVRKYFWPLLATLAIGTTPVAVINQLILGWILDVEHRDGFFYTEESDSIVRYLWDMTLLTFITAPLASVFATKFLGDAVFVERPSLRSVLAAVSRQGLRISWCQLIVRGILPAWMFMAAIERESDFQPGTEILLLGGLAFYSAIVRAWRPFINEIVLLEGNPLRSRSSSVTTVGRRSAYLHSPSSGDLVGRWIGSAAITCLLAFVVFGTFLFTSGVFLNDWRPGPFMLLFIYPLSLWIVAGFLTVVRFLSYLDLRIRHEGWETELLLRAEAVRLAGRIA